MQTRSVRKMVNLVLACTLLASLQACSPSNEYGVADAYKSSDAVVLTPYTRSIFSSSNF